MNRLSIRVKLTAAFALAMLLMLCTSALFVYIRLRDDINDRIDASLRARADALVAAHERGVNISSVPLEDIEETFVQTLSSSGSVIETAGHVRGSALTSDEARQATIADVVVERGLPGVDGRARILGRASRAGGDGVVVAVGQSLNDRNEALSSLVGSFLIGSAAAVFLASAIGFGLAKAGFAPVEAMRRRAREVSLRPNDVGLPLPRARDEVHRLGETLNEMLKRLRDSFEREQRFVTDASHELRTPVAVIKTELEGALRTGNYGPDVHDALVAAIEECDHLARLAEDLLVLARSADGGLPLRLEVISIEDLFQTIRAEFIDRAATEGRYIAIDVEPNLQIPADRSRLRQLAANLLDNAIRHGAGEIALIARRHDDGVQIEVCDRGAGFRQSFADHAFERFTRDDRTPRGAGVGLGLAIVDAIVEAHGGTAAVTPGRPCSVRVWLPDHAVG